MSRQLRASEVELVVDKLVGLCEPTTLAISLAASSKAKYIALLNDPRVNLSPLGSKLELMERIYNRIDHIDIFFAFVGYCFDCRNSRGYSFNL